MGNTVSNENNIHENIVTKKVIKFGSIYNQEKPRTGYYVNSDSVIYNTKVLDIEKDEIDNFKKLKYGYAKSHKKVFYKGIEIQNANPSTFDVVNRDEVKNMDNDNMKELCNLNSVIAYDTLKNKKRIYYKGKFLRNL